MSLEINNHTDYVLSVTLIEKIAQDISEKDIELILSDDQYIREINNQYRGIDRATDVLSFPLEEREIPTIPLGSIIISIDHAKRASKTYSHTVEEEIILLFIHGLLHLIGYDHETDQGEMRMRELELIQTYRLPESLILRTEK